MFGLRCESAAGASRSGSLKFENILNFGTTNTTLSHYLPISQALGAPGRVIWSETARYKALMGPS